MVGVLSTNQESLLGVKSRNLCISQLLTKQELAMMFDTPLKFTDGIIEGKDCYIVQGSFKPPIGGVISSLSMEFDKANLFLLRAHMSGEYQGLPFIQSSTHSYEYLNGAYYPLKMGKECKIKKNETRTTTMLGKTQKTIRTSNDIYKVEGIEEITVRAGTFRCFKIIQYDGDGNALNTYWELGRLRQYQVKSIDHETGEVIELIASNSGITKLK